MVAEIEEFCYKTVKKSKETKYVVIAILSHGVGEDVVEPTSSKVPKTKILDIIAKSPHLKDKPKILIVQACRSGKKEFDATEEIEEGFRNGRWRDILLCLSCEQGQQSKRNILTGTRYVKAFTEEFCEHAHEQDVLSMVKNVETRMRNFGNSNDQVPRYFHGPDFKKLYLHVPYEIEKKDKK